MISNEAIAIILTLLGVAWRLGLIGGRIHADLAAIKDSLKVGETRMNKHGERLDDHATRLVVVETRIGTKGSVPCAG